MKTTTENTTRILFETTKNTGEILVLSDTIFRGHRRLDLRTSFRDKQGDYHATRKGISLSTEIWKKEIIPALQAAILDMENAKG